MWRIVQLGKFYAPDLGGIETLTGDLAAGFAAAGLRSEVVAFRAGRSERVMEAGVAVERCAIGFSFDSQPFSLRWVAAAVRALRGTDAVILHVPNLLGALVAVLVRRAPLIVFWHSDVLGKRWLGRAIAPLEQAMLARASLVWVTSMDYARGSAPLRRWMGKVRVLTPGIADPVQPGGEALSAEIAGFLRRRRPIVAMGRLVAYKGFADLIAAAALLGPDLSPEWAVVIVGEGPDRPALAERVAAAGLADRVRLVGRLDDGQKRALFASAGLFVMCSTGRSEAFGIVQLEAMAHGLPVVVTDVAGSGVSAVTGRGALGALVPVGEPRALAAAIGRVLARADQEALSGAARARFEADYTLARMLAQARADVDGVMAGR